VAHGLEPGARHRAALENEGQRQSFAWRAIRQDPTAPAQLILQHYLDVISLHLIRLLSIHPHATEYATCNVAPVCCGSMASRGPPCCKSSRHQNWCAPSNNARASSSPSDCKLGTPSSSALVLALANTCAVAGAAVAGGKEGTGTAGIPGTTGKACTVRASGAAGRATLDCMDCMDGMDCMDCEAIIILPMPMGRTSLRRNPPPSAARPSPKRNRPCSVASTGKATTLPVGWKVDAAGI